MNRVLSVLARIPLRLIAIPCAILVAASIWLITRFFPAADQHKVGLILVFAVAVIFAFTLGGRRRGAGRSRGQKQSTGEKKL